jgi:vacuolar-type H+-ATPase subunit F/Vma7
MPVAAVIGEALSVEGYALAGAVVRPAESQDEARAAWQSLPPDTVLLIMTASAAGWLAAETAGRPDVLTVVMPP